MMRALIFRAMFIAKSAQRALLLLFCLNIVCAVMRAQFTYARL